MTALRLHLAQRRFGLLERHDLAIDTLLAHPPRDELGDLRAEIDDENLVVGCRVRRCHVPIRTGSRRRPVEILQLLSSGAPQQADEKPVGVGPARRHQQTFVGDKRRAGKKIGALAQRLGHIGGLFHGKIRVARRQNPAPGRRFPRRAPSR